MVWQPCAGGDLRGRGRPEPGPARGSRAAS